MASALPATLPPDEDRGPMAEGLIWAVTTLALITVVVRLYTRLFVRKSAGVDDLLMAVGMAASLVSSVLGSLQIRTGFGRHVYYLPMPEVLQSRKYLTIATLTGYVDQFFPRASIIVFSMRMTPNTLKWPRRVAWAAHGLNCIVLITAEIGFGLSCMPLRGAWDPTVQAQCYSPQVSTDLIYVTGALNCITDITAAVTPMILVRDLQMSQRVKLGIYACLALGLVCVICSIGKMAQIDFSEDFTWTLVPSEIWSHFESKLAVVVGSLPALRQLYVSLREPSTRKESSPYYPKLMSSFRQSVLRSGQSKPRKIGSHDGKRNAQISLHHLPSDTPSQEEV